MLGCGIGALFSLSLVVAMDHADSPQRAGEIVTFAQGGGYVIAALFPFIAGLAREHCSNLTGIWIFMVVTTLGIFAIAQHFAPADCHLHPRH